MPVQRTAAALPGKPGGRTLQPELDQSILTEPSAARPGHPPSGSRADGRLLSAPRLIDNEAHGPKVAHCEKRDSDLLQTDGAQGSECRRSKERVPSVTELRTICASPLRRHRPARRSPTRAKRPAWKALFEIALKPAWPRGERPTRCYPSPRCRGAWHLTSLVEVVDRLQQEREMALETGGSS